MVLPNEGIKRVKPPYYAVKVKNIDQILFVARKEFYSKEIELINEIKLKLGDNKLTLKDELK